MSKPKFFETFDSSRLDAFGVSSVLKAGAKIYYSNIFTPSQVGRVSDLIVARLKEFNPDELRLRAMLLYGVFESYSASEDKKSALNQVSVECGIDDEKVAVGVSFSFMGDPTGSLQGDFQTLLQFLTQHSDHVFVRTQISSKRVEVITVLGLGEQDSFSNGLCPLQTIEVSDAGAKVPAPVAEYVELGDLDFRTLLKSESLAPAQESGAASEFARIREKEESTELLDAIRLRGSAAQGTESIKVAGGAQATADEELDVVKVTGTTASGPELRKVKGASIAQSGASDPAAQIGSDDSESDTDLDTIVVKGKKFAVNSEQTTLVQGINAAESFFRKIWPFKKKPVEESELEFNASEVDSEPSTEAVVTENANLMEEDEDDTVTVSDPTVAKLVGELQEKALTGTLAKAQVEIIEVKKDIPNDKAKRWVDNLMGDFLQEKARLNELAKKLGTSIRQKEHEFKSKERALQQELRKRDDQIKQKTLAANRAKDQLAQVNMALERMKGAGTGEDANFKAKFNQAQKYLTNAKTENTQLLTKITELREQLMAAQAKARVAPADQGALQKNLERTQKQLEEFKKANQQLLDKLGQSKDRSAENDGVELKKRLESSLKLVHAAKKESERLSTKVEEMQKEELRLKSEMARAQAENRKLKSTVTKLEKTLAEAPQTAPGSGPKKDPKVA